MEDATTLETKWTAHYRWENYCKLNSARSLHRRALGDWVASLSCSQVLNLSTNDIWNGVILCPMSCRTFNIVSGFYLLDASSIPCLGCDKPKCLQRSPSIPWRAESLPIENHCSVACLYPPSAARLQTRPELTAFSGSWQISRTCAILQRDCVTHKKEHRLEKQAELSSDSQLGHVVQLLDFMEFWLLHVWNGNNNSLIKVMIRIEVSC